MKRTWTLGMAAVAALLAAWGVCAPLAAAQPCATLDYCDVSPDHGSPGTLIHARAEFV